MKTYLCVYLGSLCAALLTTPAVIWLARRINAVDRPGVRTVHERPVPRIGGAAIFVSAMTLIVAVVFLDNAIGQAFRQVWIELVTLLGCAALIFVVGLIDDLRGLPARVKFIVELLAAVALCAAGVRITDVGLAGGPMLRLGLWGCPLTLLWVVGITNAINLSDGLDGLAAGIGSVACGVIALFAVHSGNVIMAVFMLALLGSLSGFLAFNFNPARVFMGDCGSLFLGFTIAASSVMCVTKSSAIVGLALPVLALGVPIFDTLFSMLRRFLERRSVFAPDRSHIHHRLIDLGLRQRHAVIVIYVLTLLFAGLGLFMLVSEDLRSLVVFACGLLLIMLSFRAVGVVRFREAMGRLREKYAVAQRERKEQVTFEHLQLQFRRVSGATQWWQAICEAAERMDFAWVSLKKTYEDGRIETELWRAPHLYPNASRLVRTTLPFGDGQKDVRQEFEIAIWADGSLEAVSHRTALFSRLLDEHEPTIMRCSE